MRGRVGGRGDAGCGGGVGGPPALSCCSSDLISVELGSEVPRAACRRRDLRLCPLVRRRALGHGEGSEAAALSGPIACLWFLYIFSLT